MYQNHFTKVFSYLSIFCSCLVWQKASSLDPYYQACVPKNCDNGLNISFPFYIPGQHPSYCGYPGYEIQCSKNGYPMMRLIPNESYIVDEIFYQNRSVRVHNAVVSSSNNSCPLQIRNLTLASEMSSFFINPTSSLYLFSGCNKLLSEELLRYKISCDDANGENWGLAMLANDKNLQYALEKCKSVVVTPVEVHESDGTTGIGNYTKLLRRGILLGWVSSDCRDCAKSGGHCGFDVNIYSLKCFCPDGPRAWSCNSVAGSKRNPVVKVVIGISAAGILGAVILYLYIRRKCFLGCSTEIWRKVEKHGNIEAFLKYELLAPKRYNYSDIKKITNSFKDELGKGGYGSVYKGILREGSLVAVKVLHDLKGNGEEFVNEVASISKTSHVNIVSLLGFCYEGSKRALIYEFMPNGSLEKFIYNENSSTEDQLGWQKLFQIAVGIARGLEYLHRGCNTKILHFDIKPHNILLNKDFCPKISDFGLAKLCPDTASKVSLLGARGTIGYIAPEVFCRNFGEVSPKSDVYSFGMMVLEMVGGMKNIDVIGDLTSEFYFPHWIYDRLDLEEIGLCAITNKDEYEIARKMTIAGLWCIQTFPVQRPSMSRVVEMLEGSMEDLEIPPKPFLSSPPRLAAADSTS